MTLEEEQYYKQLQVSRARDMREQKEKTREEIAGKAAGQAAVAAASAYGIGKIPIVKTAIKKTGEAAGKKIYRHRKIIILLIAFLPIILWILPIILIVAMAYAALCYSTIGWIASKTLGLFGAMYCP